MTNIVEKLNRKLHKRFTYWCVMLQFLISSWCQVNTFTGWFMRGIIIIKFEHILIISKLLWFLLSSKILTQSTLFSYFETGFFGDRECTCLWLNVGSTSVLVVWFCLRDLPPPLIICFACSFWDKALSFFVVFQIFLLVDGVTAVENFLSTRVTVLCVFIYICKVTFWFFHANTAPVSIPALLLILSIFGSVCS